MVASCRAWPLGPACRPSRKWSEPSRPHEFQLVQRRLADVYLPAVDGNPTAIDVAITCATPCETQSRASQEPLASAATSSASLNCRHFNTAADCTANGISHQRLVAMGTGAWEAGAGKALELRSGCCIAGGPALAAQRSALYRQPVRVRARRSAWVPATLVLPMWVRVCIL